MSLFWNYLAKCPCFETQFLKNRAQFNENWVTCKMLHGTRVPYIYIYIYIFYKVILPITRFSKNRVFHWNSIFRKSSLK